jgi:hypothetical protein
MFTSINSSGSGYLGSLSSFPSGHALIPYITAKWDPTSAFSSGASSITVPVAGLYQICIKMSTVGLNTACKVGIYLFCNGSQKGGGQLWGNNNTNNWHTFNFLTFQSLAAGDVLTGRFVQNFAPDSNWALAATASGVGTGANEGDNEFTVTLVSAT